MGLDSVEIVLRVEETFSIDLPDDECAALETVGDMFRAILRKLQLDYHPAAEIERSASGRDYSRRQLLSLVLWSTADVWMTLRGIIMDQLQVDMEDIRESAHFVRDLGCA
jgi:acyl carrier protein